MLKIGWIGLGAMGKPMAANLLRAGYQVYVYNRTKDKAEELLQAGACLASSPKEVSEHSDIIITMVSDSAAVESVLTRSDGILSAQLQGKIIVDMSTTGPNDSKKFSQLVNDHGGLFLDAPVSGSVKPAQDGTLIVLVGGDAEVYEKCRPIFDVLGKTSIHFGDNGSGSSAKLVINSLLGITMHGISESLMLASQLGLNTEQVLFMMSESALNSPLLQAKKQMLLQEEFPAAFALKLMTKDLKLTVDAATQANTPLPTVATVLNTFLAAKANNKGDLDMASVYLQLKEMAGK
ncbi:NAD(P)-dependent oxidoreductase [Paenibacillus sediminis]|uniref:3-hydroxyisobutyrate dehydrogenase n=1 Tax=Paenibacillus sediminis TaxID=664909 RepID=A0ABS4H4T0_9BACL|nr:NAD(P)-dependent oxidoreductase [Paenibacillus sediminis]MBP1937543.1 3-hydroxyisobutyrate dehydrogenase [Paenibacillus sediminis]